jgi:hypothetical protein
VFVALGMALLGMAGICTLDRMKSITFQSFLSIINSILFYSINIFPSILAGKR